MKTLVPLNNIDHLEKLIDAGADEFYMGFYDFNWYKEFSEYDDINRMSGFKEYANRYDFEEMIEIAKMVKRCHKSFFVTMNANNYNTKELEYMEKHYFPFFKEANIDGLIVSDPHLVSLAVKHDIPVVASTMAAIYNVDIARYYYNLGMRRMILPRDLSLEEISSITTAFPDVEFEVFFMRNGCVFSDCYCLGMHRAECGSTCAFVKSSVMNLYSTNKTFDEKQAIDYNNKLYNQEFHRETCGMCALYQLSQMNISSLKIVGRADYIDGVVEDVKLTKKNLELIDQVSNEQEYLNQMTLPDNASNICIHGYSCYYPEVRFDV